MGRREGGGGGVAPLPLFFVLRSSRIWIRISNVTAFRKILSWTLFFPCKLPKQVQGASAPTSSQFRWKEVNVKMEKIPRTTQGKVAIIKNDNGVE